MLYVGLRYSAYATGLCCSKAICANDGNGGGEGTRGGLSPARLSIFNGAGAYFIPIVLLFTNLSPVPAVLLMNLEDCALISSADIKLPDATATTLLAGVVI